MNFFSKRKFNLLDLVTTSWAANHISNGHYWTGAGILCTGLVVSVLAELVWGAE